MTPCSRGLLVRQQTQVVSYIPVVVFCPAQVPLYPATTESAASSPSRNSSITTITVSRMLPVLLVSVPADLRDPPVLTWKSSREISCGDAIHSFTLLFTHPPPVTVTSSTACLTSSRAAFLGNRGTGNMRWNDEYK